MNKALLNIFIFSVFPFAGLIFVCLLSFFQKILIGANAFKIMGYAVPSVTGVMAGCAVYASGYWYKKAYSKEVEQRLDIENLNKSHEGFLQTLSEGICSVNDDGMCLYANASALRVLDCQKTELVGRNLFQLIEKEPSRLKEFIESREIKHLDAYSLYRVDGSRFRASVTIYPSHSATVITINESSSEESLKKKINFLNSHDSLCGFLNKDAWRKCLEDFFKSSRKDIEAKDFLFILDLDRFKLINDEVSYAAGDHYLKDFSQFLAFKIGSAENLCRLSGDSFSFLLRDCSYEQATEFSSALLQSANLFETSWQGRPLTCSVSIGGCPIDARFESFDHVLYGAEAACKNAKEAGRAQVRFYDPDDEGYRHIQGLMKSVFLIQTALSKDLFFLRGQKIASVCENEHKSGMEILVSMVDEKGDIVSPGQFIPAAEKYDLMVDIDRWVVKNSIAWLERNACFCDSIDFISINLSGKTFDDHAFGDFLYRIIQESTVLPEKLCFEITETAAMRSREKSIGFIQKIKSLGCRFALDDFGTGMASFEYIKNFPVDFIKIDGSFVLDLENDEVSQEVVQSVKRIGDKLGIKVIAEHAESAETLDLLRAMEIDYVQGYIIEKPSPLADESLSMPCRVSQVS